MPIDSSIYQSIKPIQVEPQINNLANVLKLQDLQQSGQFNALKMQEAQRGIEQQNNLRSILSGVTAEDKPDAIAQRLMKGGFLKEASDYQKTNRENLMNAAKEQEHRLNAAQKANEMAGSVFGAIRSAPSLDTVKTGLTHLMTTGALPQDKAQALLSQYEQAQTPEMIAKLADVHFRSALAPKEQMPKFDTRNIGGSTQTWQTDPVTGKAVLTNSITNTQSPESVASNQRLVEEGKLNRAQSDRHHTATQTSGQTVYDPERGVLVNKVTGVAKPASMANGEPVEPKEKNLTEGQAKAVLFGSRMENANKILSNLADKGTNTGVPFAGSGVMSGALNPLLSGNQQSLNQAKRDFVNATLRRESGATITTPEFDNAEKQYFPQVGDTPEVIKQKAENRATAIRGMKAEVPKAAQGKFKEVEGSGAPTKANASAMDKQAAAWANANPNDPRAAAIKQRLGL